MADTKEAAGASAGQRSAPESQGLPTEGRLSRRVGVAAVRHLVAPETERPWVDDVLRGVRRRLSSQTVGQLWPVCAGQDAGLPRIVERLTRDEYRRSRGRVLTGIGDQSLDLV